MAGVSAVLKTHTHTHDTTRINNVSFKTIHLRKRKFWLTFGMLGFFFQCLWLSYTVGLKEILFFMSYAIQLSVSGERLCTILVNRFED